MTMQNPELQSTGISQERTAVYGFVEQVLNAQEYCRLNKGRKGMVRRLLVKTTGYSRAQVTRLIARWAKSRCVIAGLPRRRRFPTRYTAVDVALLARLDAAHEDLSGPAVKHILKREYEVFGKAEYARLAGLSVSHIYNLRRSPGYRDVRVWVRQKSTPPLNTGTERIPGYLSFRTVRKANPAGDDALCQITATDDVTKWTVTGCVQTLSERQLIPVLEAMLHQVPFQIRGCRCDKDSRLLSNLLMQFTATRPYSKADTWFDGNLAGAGHADSTQKFFTAHFNPYVNYHRPCGFAAVKSKLHRSRIGRAEFYQTPYEKLLSLPNWQDYLKPGITPALLQWRAGRLSDTESAEQMQSARLALALRREMQSADESSSMEFRKLQTFPFSALSAPQGSFRATLSTD
jgi:hypothetical protein